jgi:hypothetical protein
MITRRKFVQVAAWSGAAVAAGSWTWRDLLGSLFARGTARLSALVHSPEEQLRGHFPYLDLEPAGVARFLSDYERYESRFVARSPLPVDVYTRYLLSTDFFQHGADESRQIQYVGFYDPYVTPCLNPLARL